MGAGSTIATFCPVEASQYVQPTFKGRALGSSFEGGGVRVWEHVLKLPHWVLKERLDGTTWKKAWCPAEDSPGSSVKDDLRKGEGW